MSHEYHLLKLTCGHFSRYKGENLETYEVSFWCAWCNERFYGMMEPFTVEEKGGEMSYELGKGIVGFAVEKGGRIYIPYAESIVEGQGHMGRFIDGLSPRCSFSGIICETLADMLTPRGWTSRLVWAEAMQEEVLVFDHPSAVL